MILTNTKIQTAIIKAWYSIALKSIKYYGGLAVGINNSCLLKQIRLLRAYVEILKNFEIVEKPHQCDCCIKGTYNTELIKDIPSSVAQFQFNDNYRGYMYFNEVGYPFSYSYTTQNKLVIKFDLETMANIECDDLLFTSTCSLSNNNETDSPLNESIFEVTNPAIENPLYLSSLAILDDEEAFIYNMAIPNAIKNDPEAIVELWNTTYGYTGFIANYIDNQYLFYSSIENNYYGWYARLSQYEGGVDSFAYFEDIMQGQPFITSNTPAETTQLIPTNQFSGTIAQTNEFEIPDSFLTVDETVITIYYLGVPILDKDSGLTFEQFFTYFNENAPEGFIMEHGPSGGNNVIIKAPVASDVYNGEAISFDNTVSVVFGIFTGGVNITPGNIIVTDETLGVIYSQTSAEFVNIDDYIESFNANNTAGMTCQFAFISGSNTAITYTAPENTGAEYNETNLNYTFYGNGYEYNSDWQLGISSTIGRFRIELYDPSDVYVAALYVDSVNTNYASLEEFVTNFNNSTTNMNFVASTDGTNLTITSPEYSYNTYNVYKITFNYNYVNPIYTDINTVENLKSGALPTLTEYQDMFTTLGILGDFINQKPCDNSIVELTCLSNKDVINIIKHIDRIV